MLIYLAKGAFLIRSSPDFWYFLISIRALVPGQNLLGLLIPPDPFFYLYNQKYSSYSTCSTYFILIFIGIYCILKSFKNEIHFECSPFFPNFFAPSPVSLDVDGLTPSSGRTFLYGVFFVFAILSGENFMNCSCVFTKEWHEISF